MVKNTLEVHMKKLTSILLSMTLLLALAACGGNEAADKTRKPPI